MLWNEKCNVVANDRSSLLNLVLSEKNSDRKFVVGDKLMTKEPLAVVSRNNDREFSDIINWVVHALFYGDEQGLTKNSTLCDNNTNLTFRGVDLDFLNAIYCVGNYGEIFFGGNEGQGMNQINNGTNGMLYAIPFGNMKNGDGDLFHIDRIASGELDDFGMKGSLNCGVVVPDDFHGEIEESTKLAGMSVEYCRTLAAALFHGDSDLTTVTRFSESDESSFA